MLTILLYAAYEFQRGYKSEMCNKGNVVVKKNDILGTWNFEQDNSEYYKSRISFTPLSFMMTGFTDANLFSTGEWEFNEQEYVLKLHFNNENITELFSKVERNKVLNPHLVSISQANRDIEIKVYFNKEQCNKKGMTFFIDSAEFFQVI
jgi:hypothetical protein